MQLETVIQILRDKGYTVVGIVATRNNEDGVVWNPTFPIERRDNIINALSDGRFINEKIAAN